MWAHGVTKEVAHLVNRTTVVAHGVTKDIAHLVNWTTVVSTRSHKGGCLSRILEPVDASTILRVSKLLFCTLQNVIRYTVDIVSRWCIRFFPSPQFPLLV